MTKTVVNIYYEWEPEGWSATSPDLPGYLAYGESLEEARALVREGVPFHLEMDADQVQIKEPNILTAPTLTIGGTVATFATGSSFVVEKPLTRVDSDGVLDSGFPKVGAGSAA